MLCTICPYLMSPTALRGRKKNHPNELIIKQWRKKNAKNVNSQTNYFHSHTMLLIASVKIWRHNITIYAFFTWNCLQKTIIMYSFPDKLCSFYSLFSLLLTCLIFMDIQKKAQRDNSFFCLFLSQFSALVCSVYSEFK